MGRFAGVARVASVFLLAHCGGADLPRGDISDFPHADGASWTYDVARDGGSLSKVVARIDGASQVGDVLAQRLTLSSDAGNGQLLWQVRPDALLLFRLSGAGTSLSLEPPLRLLGFPFQLGDAFQSSSHFALALLDVQVTVQTRVAGFGPVSTPGGTFDESFRLDSTVTLSALGVAFQTHATSWLAPQVGLVRAETDVPQNPLLPLSGHITLQLAADAP